MMNFKIIRRYILLVCLVTCLYLLSQSKLIVDMTLRGQQRQKLEFNKMPNPCGNESRRKAESEDILCMCIKYRIESKVCVPEAHPSMIEVGKKCRENMMFEDYVDRFNATIIENSDDGGYHTTVTGHGDPMDFYDFHWNYKIPQNDPKAEELKWTTPYLIKHVNPDVKLLLSLRDPVEMLYSYYFFTNQGESSLDFHKDAIKSMATWSDCTKFHSHRHCLYDLDVLKKMKVRLNRAFYSSHLKEWLKVFPRQQILIFRTEDYKKDIRGTLQMVFDYLNLPSLSHITMDYIAELPEMFVTRKKAKAGPILPKTKRLLVQFYRNSTLELAELLNDDRFAFKDVSFS